MNELKMGLILQFTNAMDASEEGGGTSVSVGLKGDAQAPDTIFITNPKIRRALYEQSMRRWDVFGGVFYTYRPDKKEISYSWYFPIPEGGGFEKKGIAKLIEFYTIKKAKERFPEAKKIIFNVDPQRGGRVGQLRRAGLNRKEISRGTDFDSYIKRTTKKMHQGMWKAKGKLPQLRAKARRAR